MKRIVICLLTLLAAGALAACGKKASLVGVWRIASFGGESVIEFTADGDFVDRVSGSINKYRIEGNTVVTYVEDAPGSEAALPFELRDGVLYFGGEAYEKVENPL